MTDEPRVAFTVDGVSKTYPGVRALQGVTLEGHAGEVLAICGANGAGKSTLSKILAGQEPATEGEIRITGFDRPLRSPADAEEAGVLLMHQEPVIVDDFSVGENVWLRDLSSAGGTRAWGIVPRSRREATEDALHAVGLHGIRIDRPAGDLGPGLRQMLALSRTQVTDHRVLLLDETTASTTEDHFQDVLELVQRERAAGVAVIFVSHRMDEVFAMSDRIAVLRNGTLVDVVRTADTTPDQVMTLMIGTAVRALEPPAPLPTDAPALLEVRGLGSGSARDIDIDVRRGEIVGLYGLVGSGRSSIARAISGNQSRDTGTVALDGKPVDPASPRDGIRAGIAYLTEDRRREGFVGDFTNGENMTLAAQGRYARGGVIRRAAERTRVGELIARFQVKGGADTLTRTLSGGNQQKVIIAKWLETAPELVILDEPTKGIDVGARLNIYEIIRELAEQGRGVLVVTSEAEEALTLCNRVLALKEGRVVGEFTSADASTDDLIRASLGGAAA